MNYKKIIPCIYLFEGKALDVREESFVQGISGDKIKKIEDYTPISLAKHYSDNGADAILVFDLSSGDEQHDAAIHLIQEMARTVDTPLYGAGNIKRVEDVKKLLYAGCQKAFLNFGRESGKALLEEVSKRFGKEKIGVTAICEADYEGAEAALKEYADQLLWMDPQAVPSEFPIAAIAAVLTDGPEQLSSLLKCSSICAVWGNGLNACDLNFLQLKNQLKSAGIVMNTYESAMEWAEFKLNSDGMLPVIVQDYKTDEVLMMAYMNEEAYQMTVDTGRMTYYSRSRQELWIKGLTSGHFQYVKALFADCDKDTLLAKVSQVGAACHTGAKSCFYRPLVKKEYDAANPLKVFEDVYQVILDRKENPKEGSYTNYLFDKGVDKILKKLGEEATEIVIAAKNPDPEEIKYEISDFLYHAMVLMAEKGVDWQDITKELARR